MTTLAPSPAPAAATLDASTLEQRLIAARAGSCPPGHADHAEAVLRRTLSQFHAAVLAAPSDRWTRDSYLILERTYREGLEILGLPGHGAPDAADPSAQGAQAPWSGWHPFREPGS